MTNQSSEITNEKLNESKNNTDSAEIANSKKQVVKICNSLKELLADSKQRLIDKHGTDQEGNIKNKSEHKHVKEIFLTQKIGTKIKESFIEAENQIFQIAMKHQLDITREDIPITLNFFMEKEGQSWEEYLFKEMPVTAVLPMFTKLKNDVTATEYRMLKKLNNK